MPSIASACFGPPQCFGFLLPRPWPRRAPRHPLLRRGLARSCRIMHRSYVSSSANHVAAQVRRRFSKTVDKRDSPSCRRSQVPTAVLNPGDRRRRQYEFSGGTVCRLGRGLLRLFRPSLHSRRLRGAVSSQSWPGTHCTRSKASMEASDIAVTGGDFLHPFVLQFQMRERKGSGGGFFGLQEH